ASTSFVLKQKGIDLQREEYNAKSYSPSAKLTGEDAPAWRGAMGLIKFLSFNQIDSLIEGKAIRPEGVKDLMDEDSDLKIRAAFVGYSKVMEFKPPEEWASLDRLIEKVFGRGYLDYFHSYNWMYHQMEPYNDIALSESMRDAESKLHCDDFRYFDLI